MSAWKEQTRKIKFIELARKKKFQKKKRTENKLLHMPLKKEPGGPKKCVEIYFLKKFLSKHEICKEYVWDFCVLCTKYAWV